MLTEAAKFKLRVVFMGSALFSVPSLKACLSHARVVAVYTQPGRRSGRGRKQRAISPVGEVAAEYGLPLEQPVLFDKQTCERIRGYKADLVVVAAYGQILPRAALDAPRLASINVHASLLPRHRGAAPIAATIRSGDAETGVTVIRMRPRLDAGEILCLGTERRKAQVATRIGDDETAGELTERLAAIGGDLLVDVLAAFAQGAVTYEAQDEPLATYAPMLTKADGLIPWSATAEQVLRHIRAMTPWPGAYCEAHMHGCRPTRLVVLRARRHEAELPGRSGTVFAVDGHMLVKTGLGSVELLRVKPASRDEMSGADFLRGHRLDAHGLGRDGDCWLAGA